MELNFIRRPLEKNLRRVRRSWVAEDMDTAKEEQNLNELITTTVQTLLNDKMTDLLKALQERDQVICDLQQELAQQRVAKHSSPLINAASKKESLRLRDNGNGGGNRWDGIRRAHSFRSTTTTKVAVHRVVKNGHTLDGTTCDDSDTKKCSPVVIPTTTSTKKTDPALGGQSKKSLQDPKRPNGDHDGFVSSMDEVVSLNGACHGPTDESTFDNDTILAHLKRLTEEHAKLQAEYARTRAALQIARVQPPAQSSVDNNCAHSELASLQQSCADDDSKESNVEKAAGFRREILRLKEELLSEKQKANVYLHEFLACNKELQQLQQDYQVKKSKWQQRLANRDEEGKELQLRVADLQKKVHEAEESRDELGLRLKDAENDHMEMKEFLQEELESSSEVLRDVEDRLEQQVTRNDELCVQLKDKEEQNEVLMQVLAKTQAKIELLENDLKGFRDASEEKSRSTMT